MPPTGSATSSTAKHMTITSTTWARDSHDLFDYECRHANTKNFRTAADQNSIKMVRQGVEVRALTENESVPSDHDYLLRLQQRDGQFTVFPAEKTAGLASPKRLWMVVRDLATRGHNLNEGDIIKLGRFKLRVRQCNHTDSDSMAELRLDDEGSILKVDDINSEHLKTTPCKICLLDGCEDDYLIAPCACKGSIRYVHLECLRTWIRGRLNLQENQRGSYFYKQLPCELCKANYPSMVEIEGKRVPLVPIPKTQAPFLVLENMVRDTQVHSNRGLHVISLAENKLLKLGRGHESDVRIADVSISRCHATIRYDKGNFVLEDHCSKFGTLVAIKKNRVVEQGFPLSIQVGRSVLSFAVEDGAGGQEENQPVVAEGAQGPVGENSASSPRRSLMQNIFGASAPGSA